MIPDKSVALTRGEIKQSELVIGLPIKIIHYKIKLKIRTFMWRNIVNPSTITYIKVKPNQAIRLFNILEWKCVYCNRLLTMKVGSNEWEADQLTIDHVKPLSKQGEHSISNIVCACRECNELKTNDDLEAFLDKRKLDSNEFNEKLMVARIIYGLIREDE